MIALLASFLPADATAQLSRFRTGHGRLLVLGLAALVIVAAWVAPGLFASQPIDTGDLLERLQTPSLAHLFGTDHLGRDLWARAIHGLGHTLNAGLLSISISFVFGVGLGIAAGLGNRWVDNVVMRGVDMVLALPALVVVILLVSSIARETLIVAVAVGFAGIPRFARPARAEVSRVRTYEYVEAAIVCGLSRTRAALQHVVPNAMPAVLAIVAVEFALHLLVIASFTFLGLGSPGPAPELGQVVSEGRNYLASAWWVTSLPGALLVGVVLVFSSIGRIFLNAKK